MKRLLGPEFKKKSDDTIISTVKSTLLKYGINTKSKLHDNGDKIITKLTMSFDPINMSYEDALTKNTIYTKDGKELSILNYIKQETTTSGEFTIDAKKIRSLLGPGFEDRDIYSLRVMLRNIFNKDDIILTSRSNRKGDVNLYFYRKNNNTSQI